MPDCTVTQFTNILVDEVPGEHEVKSNPDECQAFDFGVPQKGKLWTSRPSPNFEGYGVKVSSDGFKASMVLGLGYTRVCVTYY